MTGASSASRATAWALDSPTGGIRAPAGRDADAERELATAWNRYRDRAAHTVALLSERPGQGSNTARGRQVVELHDHLIRRLGHWPDAEVWSSNMAVSVGAAARQLGRILGAPAPAGRATAARAALLTAEVGGLDRALAGYNRALADHWARSAGRHG